IRQRTDDGPAPVRPGRGALGPVAGLQAAACPVGEPATASRVQRADPRRGPEELAGPSGAPGRGPRRGRAAPGRPKPGRLGRGRGVLFRVRLWGGAVVLCRSSCAARLAATLLLGSAAGAELEGASPSSSREPSPEASTVPA